MDQDAAFEALYSCYQVVCDESGLSPLPRERVLPLLQWMAVDANTLMRPPDSDSGGVPRR